MFNERRFKAQVVLAGMTMRQVAAELGIDEATLYRKMSGKSDFYRKEIQQLCNLLEIEDPTAVFFCRRTYVNAKRKGANEVTDIITIKGVRGYLDASGTAQLNLEDVSRGLGFTQEKSGIEYVKWERVESYLTELGFPHKWGKGDFIPENIFYRLAMKAKNEAAQVFQGLIADGVN